jgi:hypothetical protein
MFEIAIPHNEAYSYDLSYYDLRMDTYKWLNSNIRNPWFVFIPIKKFSTNYDKGMCWVMDGIVIQFTVNSDAVLFKLSCM